METEEEQELEYKWVMKGLDELYNQLDEEANQKIKDIVHKIVNLEIEAEGYCNQ